jgi:hypothetical protein
MIWRFGLWHTSHALLQRLSLCLLALQLVTQPAEAKKKRLEDRILREAVILGKDGESKFAGENAMDNEAFQIAWEAFVEKLDAEYTGPQVTRTKPGPTFASAMVSPH